MKGKIRAVIEKDGTIVLYASDRTAEIALGCIFNTHVDKGTNKASSMSCISVAGDFDGVEVLTIGRD